MGKKIPSEEIKKIEISILDYIASVCEENNIGYYPAYGTLLDIMVLSRGMMTLTSICYERII